MKSILIFIDLKITDDALYFKGLYDIKLTIWSISVLITVGFFWTLPLVDYREKAKFPHDVFHSTFKNPT